MGAKYDFDEALGFYGQYHNNPINQLIHVIFVPCIVWSAMVIFNYANLNYFINLNDILGITSKSLPFPLSYMNENTLLSFALVMTVYLTYYYATLKFFPAVTYALIILWPSLFTATSFYLNTPGAWQYALALHVFAWYMQIHPGHGIFEKRNAAIADNFWAGLLPGPFFAWFEVLFFFGWNPQLKAHLQTKIDSNIAEWKATSKAVKSQ